ncbi:MAG: hypothetical protein N3A61_01940 [Ignavibacteria bacterium]|nr:hypothetical protein [Ignavibacteria bacterium]
MNKNYEFLLKNRESFLKYFKTRYPLYYNSNIFFRDLQYAIINFFASKKMKLSYSEAELLANEFSQLLEQEKLLKKVNEMSWVITDKGLLQKTDSINT